MQLERGQTSQILKSYGLYEAEYAYIRTGPYFSFELGFFKRRGDKRGRHRRDVEALSFNHRHRHGHGSIPSPRQGTQLIIIITITIGRCTLLILLPVSSSDSSSPANFFFWFSSSLFLQADSLFLLPFLTSALMAMLLICNLVDRLYGL